MLFNKGLAAGSWFFLRNLPSSPLPQSTSHKKSGHCYHTCHVEKPERDTSTKPQLSKLLSQCVTNTDLWVIRENRVEMNTWVSYLSCLPTILHIIFSSSRLIISSSYQESHRLHPSPDATYLYYCLSNGRAKWFQTYKDVKIRKLNWN